MENKSVESAPAPDFGPRGVQSIEVGLRLLTVLSELGGESNLKALSNAAGIHPAKAHRHLVGLINAGFVEHSETTSRYSLGTRALRVGLTALRRLNLIKEGSATIDDLRDRFDEMALIAIWGTHGPVIVRLAEPASPLTVNVRLGSVVSLLDSASGRVFAALMPYSVIRPILLAELERKKLTNPENARTEAEALTLLEEVRLRQFAVVTGEMIPGITSISAPVFNAAAELAATITLVGPQPKLGDHAVQSALSEAAHALSHKMGHVT